MKGLADPVEVYELVGVTALRRRLQAAVARGLSPFVGRQAELETLRQALTQAGASHNTVQLVITTQSSKRLSKGLEPRC